MTRSPMPSKPGSLLALLGLFSCTLAAAQSLEEAVAAAVNSHPTVAISANRRFAADRQLNQARAGYFPRVDLNAGYGYARLDTVETRLLGAHNASFNRHDAGLTLTQMLFDGFAVKNEVARQQARVDSSALRVAESAEQIALRAAAAYLELLRRRDLVRLATGNVDTHRRIFEMIRSRAESGVGRRADVDQAEGRLASAQATLRAEEGAAKDAEATFVSVIGLKPVALTKPAAPENLPASEAAAVDAAARDHPAVNAARAEVAAAQAQHEAAKAPNWPRLDLELGAVRDRDNLRGQSEDYTAMLRARYNLFRGGADSARVAETRFLIQEAIETENRVRREVSEDAALSFNALLTTRDRVVSLLRYAEASDVTRDAYAKQFGIGQRTLLDLLNAESEHYSARAALATAQYTELFGAYRTFAAMGRLLGALRIAPPPASLK